MRNYSFKKGFGQLLQRDVETAKQEIMTVLGLNTRGAWWTRLHGIVEPKISEAQAIEAVFAKYGITEIWGTE